MSDGVFSQDESSVDPASVIRKPLLRTLVVGIVRLDETVALESLECRVDLADVERPHLAGAGLELFLQLEAVLWAFAEQREGWRDGRSLRDLISKTYAVWYNLEATTSRLLPGSKTPTEVRGPLSAIRRPTRLATERTRSEPKWACPLGTRCGQ